MKKLLIYIVVLPFLLTLHGCDLNDDDGVDYYFEALEVVSADFPESFEFGKIYRIDVTMLRPSTCHYFEGFDFSRTGDTNTERTIYPISSVVERTNCEELPEETITSFFDFEVLFTDTYVFKLYSGTDTSGEDQFIVYEVPVVNPQTN
ncbi:hypothetical protein [Robertkochia flava]|uniref:hypothetical protein n=1 Tax=Robertkochia flava TaxID=3447986 RepID=UPI001CCE0619|nr:hypothetical protein [Robertkochia marina]